MSASAREDSSQIADKELKLAVIAAPPGVLRACVRLGPLMAARTEAERGDIISEYPLLVLSFVAVQISGWIVGLLELFGVLGSVVGYELMDSLTPLDLAFCQAMFWGTLHHGPIDYGRLALICRVGFVIDGFIFMYSSATKFLPTGLETPVEVMRILNASSVAELFAELPAWPLFLHALQVAFWFFIFIPFSAWIGTTTLAVGRLRLLQRVTAAATFPQPLRESSERRSRTHVLPAASSSGAERRAAALLHGVPPRLCARHLRRAPAGGLDCRAHGLGYYRRGADVPAGGHCLTLLLLLLPRLPRVESRRWRGRRGRCAPPHVKLLLLSLLRAQLLLLLRRLLCPRRRRPTGRAPPLSPPSPPRAEA